MVKAARGLVLLVSRTLVPVGRRGKEQLEREVDVQVVGLGD
jgi:hypothetical protein